VPWRKAIMARLGASAMRWDMVKLRESPWYNEIFEEGFQKGLEQGIPQGQLRMVLRFFQFRFGEPDPVLARRIGGLSSEQLDRVMDVMMDATDRSGVVAFVTTL
jgi:predicted transposase YdaD